MKRFMICDIQKENREVCRQTNLISFGSDFLLRVSMFNNVYIISKSMNEHISNPQLILFLFFVLFVFIE
jgi:hypothetical protein